MTTLNGIYPEIPDELIPHELRIETEFEVHAQLKSEQSPSKTIEELQPLVAQVARIHKHPNVDIADAISIANQALLRAIRCYNPNRNVTFKTYAIAAMKFELWKLKPVADECEIPLGENIPYQVNYTAWIKELVVSKLSTLPEREQEILRRSFGIDREQQSFQEIAKDFNLSKPRIQQLRNRALLHLKRMLSDALTPIKSR